MPGRLHSPPHAPGAPGCVHARKDSVPWADELRTNEARIPTPEPAWRVIVRNALEKLDDQVAKVEGYEAMHTLERVFFGTTPRTQEAPTAPSNVYGSKTPGEWWLDQSEMEEAITVHKWPEAIAALDKFLAGRAPDNPSPSRQKDIELIAEALGKGHPRDVGHILGTIDELVLDARRWRDQEDSAPRVDYPQNRGCIRYANGSVCMCCEARKDTTAFDRGRATELACIVEWLRSNPVEVALMRTVAALADALEKHLRAASR